MTDKHVEYLKRIEAYLAGDISPEEEKDLLDHVEGCGECSKALANAKKLEDLLVRSLGAAGKAFATPKTVKVNGVDPALLADPKFYCAKQHRLTRFRNVAFVMTIAATFIMTITLVLFMVIEGKHRLPDDLKAKFATNEMIAITAALEQHREKTGKAPTSNAGMLRDLVPYFTFKQYSIKDGKYLDPWRNPYVLQLREGKVVAIYSIGANGIDDKGAGDDIRIEVAAKK